MIAAVSSLAIRISALSVTTALMELLIPEGNIKGAARTAVSVAFISRAITYIVGIIGGIQV